MGEADGRTNDRHVERLEPAGRRSGALRRVVRRFATQSIERRPLRFERAIADGLRVGLLVLAMLCGMGHAQAEERSSTGAMATMASAKPRVAAIGTAKPSTRQRTADRLRRIDADHDGFISRAEVEHRAARLAQRFEAIDANRDGRLSVQEIRNEARSRRVAAGASQAGALRDARLSAADRDGDGRISLDEAVASLPRIAGKFARIDADGDGFVDTAEFRAWIERRRSARVSVRAARQG